MQFSCKTDLRSGARYHAARSRGGAGWWRPFGRREPALGDSALQRRERVALFDGHVPQVGVLRAVHLSLLNILLQLASGGRREGDNPPSSTEEINQLCAC